MGPMSRRHANSSLCFRLVGVGCLALVSLCYLYATSRRLGRVGVLTFLNRHEREEPVPSHREISDDFAPLSNHTHSNISSRPLILLWTSFFGMNLSLALQSNRTCPYECEYSFDRSTQHRADVRIFHARDFSHLDRPADNPLALNVYFSMECPPFSAFSYYTSPPADYFNLSITYRSTSAVHFPYDAFVELDGTERDEDRWTDEQVNEKIAGKSGAVLVAVSNCGTASSGRLAYIRELSKHINVTQVGKCNARDCDSDCLNDLIDAHHFYLAFENSICPEYVSEKFWRLKRLIVPVVLSRGVIPPAAIPSDSFIAASDFDSPAMLADFLKRSIQDRQLYRSFFEWTRRYRRISYDNTNQMPLCHLCKLAHERKERHWNYHVGWNPAECIDFYGERLLRNDVSLRRDEVEMTRLVRNSARRRLVHRVV